jgi:hypothetical protein
MGYPSIFISNQEFSSPDQNLFEMKSLKGLYFKFKKELINDLLIIENDTSFVFAHVNLALRNEIKNIKSDPEKLYSEFSFHIEKFHWGFIAFYNKKSNSLKCYNDPFGIYPLYLNKQEASFNISNDFDQLIDCLKEITFNKNALQDYFLFNYTLKSRTIFKEIKQFEGGMLYSKKGDQFKFQKSYFIGSYIFRKNDGGLDEMTKSLTENITSNLDLNKRMKIPLTGGFDTKVILSLAMENKISFDTFTFGTPSSHDTIAAKKISKQLEIKNTFYNSYEYFEKNIDEALMTFLRAAPNAPIVHTLLQYQMMKTHIKNHNIITGKMGGELIVGPILLSQLITTKAAAILTKSDKRNLFREFENVISDIGFLNTHSYVKNAPEYINSIESYNDIDGGNKRLIEFLVNETYAKFFGTVFSNIFAKSNMINPFMDLRFLRALFNSKYSITSKKVFSSSPFGHFQSRKLYPKLIQRSFPEILKSPMDRGYNLEDFLYWYKYPKPILNYVKRKIKGNTKTQELDYLSLLNDKLKGISKDSPLFKLDLIDTNKLDEMIKNLKNNNISNFHYQKLIQLFVLDLLAKKYAQKIKFE